MIDPQLNALSARILRHSVNLKKNERVFIDAAAPAKPLVMALVREAKALGADVFARLKDEEISRCLLEQATDTQIELATSWDIHACQSVDAVVVINTTENDAELSDIGEQTMQANARIRRPWVDLVTNQKKWVLLNWPTKAQAQKARMPFESFYDFVIGASTIDYSAMEKNMRPLSELLAKTDKVQITGPGTNLSFSVKGIPNEICAGRHNLPDGEIFTAPVRDSVQGHVTYNTPCPYHGKVYTGVRLDFENGRVTHARADSDLEQLNAIFDTDEGARYVGEFALGLNPIINRAFGNILFDEKIAGSFHFTPGNAYENSADNGNRSAIHWDMVCIQTAEAGGGEIRFDGVLVRKNGLFVLPGLKALNPAG